MRDNLTEAEPAPCSPLLDSTGREIMVGDTLKIFHFIGARRKRYYMYKFVEAKEMRRTWTRPMLRISHLGRDSSYYLEALDGRKMEDVEIVQGFGDDGTAFEDRPILEENREISDAERSDH